MLKDSLKNTKKTKRAKLYEQARNYTELQALDSQIIQLEGLMREDKDAVVEMNKRILMDLQKVELDRSTQIKKLVISFAQALAENSQRVKSVFDSYPNVVSKLTHKNNVAQNLKPFDEANYRKVQS